jgi:hypothetical protein
VQPFFTLSFGFGEKGGFVLNPDAGGRYKSVLRDDATLSAEKLVVIGFRSGTTPFPKKKVFMKQAFLLRTAITSF